MSIERHNVPVYLHGHEDEPPIYTPSDALEYMDDLDFWHPVEIIFRPWLVTAAYSAGSVHMYVESIIRNEVFIEFGLTGYHAFAFWLLHVLRGYKAIQRAIMESARVAAESPYTVYSWRILEMIEDRSRE